VRLHPCKALFIVCGLAAPAAAQSAAPLPVTTVSYGTLNQDDLAIRVRNEDVEIRFIPLDAKVTRLLANDAFQSLRALVESRRRSIDSVASRAGVAEPGLALVSFFGLRSDTRFDPQTLTVRLRSRALQPLGIIPINARFTSHQLNLREQASAIYLFEEDLPVDDSFSLSYGALVSEDWQRKQSLIDRERARVSARARSGRPDTTAR
jgi:hypothetical protein